MASGDTIAAIATAPGRGGVAVVRVSGPDAFALAEKISGRPIAPARVSLRRLRLPDGRVVDEAIVVAFRAPRSYTGEDVVELQCHGGSVTPRRVLEACYAFGARPARRGEFTERAFLNGRLDYSQAESVLNLVDAKTARAADAALDTLSGRRRRDANEVYTLALDLSSTLEHALDVDEGDLAPEFFRGVRGQAAALDERLAASIRRAREGRILRDGALVVLAGAPNAGKSSLLNALLEENRAIVSDTPGTTRDAIESWIDLDGWPVRLVDTAGLRASSDAIEAEGVRRAEDLISRADVVLALDCDPEVEEGHIVSVHAKCDLGRAGGLNVSSKTGEGLEELKHAVVERLEALSDVSVDAADATSGEDFVAACIDARALVADLAAPSDERFDLVLAANAARSAAERLGAAVGATYSDDLLDRLFSRFCVGK